MTNRFGAALRTYTTRRDFWYYVASSLLWYSIIMASRQKFELAGVAVFFVNMLPAMMIGFQLNFQFASPRARLLPHFAVPHLVAAGIIVAAAVVLEVCLLVWIRGASPLAAAGFALAIIAFMTWAFCGFSGGLYRAFLRVSFIPLFLASLVLGRSVESYLLGGSPMLAIAAVCVGLAALAALGVRVWTLSEEVPEYSIRVPVSLWDFTSRASRRDRRQLEARAIRRSPKRGWLYDRGLRFTLHAGTVSAPLGRLLLHQASRGFPGLSFAPWQLGLVLYVFWLRRWYGIADAASSGPSFFLLSSVPVLMAMSMFGGLWARHWPYLARESLHPVSRTDFVRNVIADYACDTLAVALGDCAGIVVGVALFHVAWPLVALVLPYLAMTLLQFFAMYCVTLWLIPFRSFWALLLGNLLAVPLSAALVVAVVSNTALFGPASCLLTLAVAAAAAVGISRLTLRHWCRLEFD